MNKLILNFIGTDSWSRPVFKDEDENIFKDTNLGDGAEHGIFHLCTSYDFEGEPDTPIEYIEKYKDVEFEIVGMEEEPTREEKSRYMLLSRLQQDCNYYLGNGNRYKEHLWAGDEKDQIEKMKELYNSFSDDKKPEWITLNEILNYENEMTHSV